MVQVMLLEIPEGHLYFESRDWRLFLVFDGGKTGLPHEVLVGENSFTVLERTLSQYFQVFENGQKLFFERTVISNKGFYAKIDNFENYHKSWLWEHHSKVIIDNFLKYKEKVLGERRAEDVQ